jgi:beta-glucosidase-like glycosyl hydrolase
MNKYRISMALLATLIFAQGYAKQSLENPEELLASLSLRDKIAQLIIAAAVSNEDANKDFMKQSPYRMDKNQLEFLIKHCHIGGVIFLGSGIRSEQAARTKYYQKISDIPLLIVCDAEYGSAMRLRDGFAFPHNMTLGALQDDSLIYDMGYYIGLDLQQLGVHMNLAPVVDVNNNAENPIIYDRSFGSDPYLVARKSVQFTKGLQKSGMMACAKHFPGHGDTTIDSHVALPTIAHSRNHLDEIELVPFKAAIANQVDAIMIAHIAVPELESTPNLPASLSHSIVTDLLKEQLGFDGLILTDGLGMCGATINQQAGMLELQALLAGADMLLCPRDASLVIKFVLEAVEKGMMSQELIDQKVLRVLKTKQRALCKPVAPVISKEEMQKLKEEIYCQAVTQLFDKRTKSAPGATLAVVPSNRNASENFGITAEQIQQLEKKKSEGIEVTVVIFGTPYAAELFAPYAHRLIVAYEDTPETRAAVEHVINGTRIARGKLPVSF